MFSFNFVFWSSFLLKYRMVQKYVKTKEMTLNKILDSNLFPLDEEDPVSFLVDIMGVFLDVGVVVSSSVVEVVVGVLCGISLGM